MKAITNFYLVVLVLISLGCLTVNAESPFSSLGHGLLIESANARSAAMGYTSLAILDTLSLDRRNISAWSGPATARFGLGGEILRSVVDDINGSDLRDEGGFSGLAIAFPIGVGRFLGLAISPLTRVNYKWSVVGSADQDWSSIIEEYQGSGGISQGLVGVSFQLRDSFRFGIGARAIFGKLERLWKVEFPDATSRATSHLKSDRFKGVGLSLSAHNDLSHQWSIGMAVNSPVKVRVQRQNLIHAGSLIQVDSTGDLSENWDVPLEISLGVGRRLKGHALTGEIAWKGWGSVNEPSVLTDRLEDALRTSAGWEWTPGYSAFDPFWRVLTYRGGFYYREHYALSTGGNQSYRLALTGGLGVPYYRGRARIDFAFEMGLMGTKSDDGVTEKFVVLTVGFNHSEHWFQGINER